MMSPRTERAWAAGLFEGEGSVNLHREGRRRKDGTRRSYPRLYMGNTSRELLERFHLAVSQEGNIVGPYPRQGGKTKPIWQWYAAHLQAREVVKLLYPFLGPYNRKRMEVFRHGRNANI